MGETGKTAITGAEAWLETTYAELRSKLESATGLNLQPVRRLYVVQGDPEPKQMYAETFHIPRGPKYKPPSHAEHLLLVRWRMMLCECWEDIAPNRRNAHGLPVFGDHVADVYLDTLRPLKHGRGRVNWSALALAMGFKYPQQSKRVWPKFVRMIAGRVLR